MRVTLKKNDFIKKLLKIVLLLNIGNAISFFLIYYIKPTKGIHVISFLNLDKEQSFGTMFSFLILLTSSFLLILISIHHKNTKSKYKKWMYLSFVFLFLAMDEFLGIHELLRGLIGNFHQFKGLLYFSWILPYSMLVVLIAMFFTKFLLQLPRRTRILFTISGLVYVGGAIGLEMIGGYIMDRIENYSEELDIGFFISYTIEETLEMVGIVMFIYSLVEYITSNCLCNFEIKFIK